MQYFPANNNHYNNCNTAMSDWGSLCAASQPNISFNTPFTASQPNVSFPTPTPTDLFDDTDDPMDWDEYSDDMDYEVSGDEMDCWTVSITADVPKSRLQWAPESTYSGSFDVLRQPLQKEGPSALFTGIRLASIRAFHVNAMELSKTGQSSELRLD